MSLSESIILIGSKPSMNYVLTIALQFNKGVKRIRVKARGEDISKAVNVVEILRTRYLRNRVVIKEVRIGSESIGEGEEKTISIIEITLERK